MMIFADIERRQLAKVACASPVFGVPAAWHQTDYDANPLHPPRFGCAV